MKKRIDWIDVVKCFGMFAIYLGHEAAAGKSVTFVFYYHVALFFMISGCMESQHREIDFKSQVIKKIRGIMIPFWIFALISTVIQVINDNAGVGVIKEYLGIIIKGCVRNEFFAAALWFLPCLFVMEIMFALIRRLRKSVWILAACIGLFIIADKFITPHPEVSPHMWYNLDSAMYYIMYYGIGFVAFPWIQKLFELDTKPKKLLFGISGIAAMIYAVYLWEGTDLLLAMANIPVLCDVWPVLRTLLMIWLHFIMARVLQKVTIFQNIGQHTLYLCGSEYMVRILVPCAMAILGIQVVVPAPLYAYTYTVLIMVLAYKVFVPLEKVIIQNIKAFMDEMFQS